MGGTSTDCSTVIDGQVAFTTDFEIEWGLPIQVPMIDIRTIGAGGGSIAWIDKGGLLRVGPQSAGAMPGPACYGRGGTAATVTDANVVLGRIDPDFFLGGAMKLDAAAASAAVEQRSPRRIGKDVEETALAIVRIANNNMVGAIRAVLIERGLDPRDFTLVGFRRRRTAAPGRPDGRGRHPARAGAEPSGPVLRLWLRRHRCARRPAPHAADELAALRPGPRRRRLRRACPTRCASDLAAQGHREGVSLTKALEMRYLGQNYEMIVPVDYPRLDAETAPKLWQSFHDLHQGRFGFSMPDSTVEIINFMITGDRRRREGEAAGAGQGHRAAASGRLAPPCGLRGRRHRGAGLFPRQAARRPPHRRSRGRRGGGLGDDRAARPAPQRRPLGQPARSCRRDPQRRRRMDMVTMTILESTMVAICREMGITLMKTSYSTIFNEGLDFSCGFANARGDLIAVADFCPAHIGGMPLLIQSSVRELANETIEEGDVIVHNDPYRGGLHTPEHTFFKPIFVDGELIGYAVSIGHVSEIGGSVPGSFASEATEIFQEGLRVPPVKIKKARRGQ